MTHAPITHSLRSPAGPRSLRRRALAGAVGVLLPVLAGCNVIPPPQADATRYYILSSGDGSAPQVGKPAVGGDTGGAPASVPAVGLRLSVGPGYLDGRRLVVRKGPNEVAIQDYSLWAEPLAAALRRCVADRLGATGRIVRILPAPLAPDQARSFNVDVEILRCEGVIHADGRAAAAFAARITVTDPAAENRVEARSTYTAPEAPWDGQDFGALAGRLSSDADGLARAIADLLPPQAAGG